MRTNGRVVRSLLNVARFNLGQLIPLDPWSIQPDLSRGFGKHTERQPVARMRSDFGNGWGRRSRAARERCSSDPVDEFDLNGEIDAGFKRVTVHGAHITRSVIDRGDVGVSRFAAYSVTT
ncbi:hypothetical protein BH23CHL2_BH23CHL2_23040 [soil metagenome]